MLGENVALVSFINKQQAKDDAIVNVRAGTYSLRRTDDGWKIAVISTYPPAVAICNRPDAATLAVN